MDPITITDLTQVGRVNAPDPSQPRIFVTYNADFSAAANIILDFTVVNQQQTFGIVRSLGIDNGSNPNEVEVSVSGTDDYFTVPAYAQGVFKINATNNSRISFVTDGGATDKVTISLYNWEVAPAVWYRFGAFNVDRPIKIEGANPAGTDMDTADNNYPVYLAGIQSDGTLTPIRVDSQGRLDFASSTTIGAVTGPDADGAPSTSNPLQIAGNDGTNVQRIITDTTGRLLIVPTSSSGVAQRFGVTNADLVASGTANAPEVNAWMRLSNGVAPNPIGTFGVSGGFSPGYALGAGIIGILDDTSTLPVTEGNGSAVRISADRSLLVTARATSPTTTSVSDTASNVTLLAANNARKGATIYNDSTQVLYVKLGATASTTSFTVKLQPEGYYEVPFGYVGIIDGIWAADGSGAARITEIA